MFKQNKISSFKIFIQNLEAVLPTVSTTSKWKPWIFSVNKFSILIFATHISIFNFNTYKLLYNNFLKIYKTFHYQFYF